MNALVLSTSKFNSTGYDFLIVRGSDHPMHIRRDQDNEVRACGVRGVVSLSELGIKTITEDMIEHTVAA